MSSFLRIISRGNIFIERGIASDTSPSRWRIDMKKLIIFVMFLVMIVPIFMFGQEAEDIDQIKADLKHQQFLMQEELLWQSTMIQIKMQMMIDEINNRIYIQRLFPELYCPYIWEPVEYPFLYLPSITDGFPLLNTMDIIY